jgi:hypothetical protein
VGFLDYLGIDGLRRFDSLGILDYLGFFDHLGFDGGRGFNHLGLID